MNELWKNMKTFFTEKQVDVVVIGTGAGGAPALARLAGANLSVVAIEAGERFDPYADFANDERSQAKLFWTHERLSFGENPLSFGSNNSGKGVGGSTVHFTAYTPRPDERSLRLRKNSGKGRDWPLEFSDLVPYFEEIETFLGVSGPETYPWDPGRRFSYPLPPLPLNAPAKIMASACAKLGMRTAPAANAALSAPYFQDGVGMRPACTNRGYCQVGCNIGAKSSMDVTYIPLALSRGAEIRTESFVLSLEVTGKKITGVTYQRNGKIETQKCHHVFLAAGGVETPRLLLRQKLANSSGQVGKNLMAHPGLQVWGFFEEETLPYRGIPGSLICEDFQKAPDNEYAGGYLLQSIGAMPLTYVTQLIRGRGLWGSELFSHMRKYRRVAGINMLGDCLPSEHNYLELSDEKDDLGLPKPAITFSYGENEKKMIGHAEKNMRKIWDIAGGTELWSFERSAHIIGTCRMGEDSADSVVDPRGRAHDIANLYIVDNSVFPSALGVNPALMIMANSLRVSDQFLKDIK